MVCLNTFPPRVVNAALVYLNQSVQEGLLDTFNSGTFFGLGHDHGLDLCLNLCLGLGPGTGSGFSSDLGPGPGFCLGLDLDPLF